MTRLCSLKSTRLLTHGSLLRGKEWRESQDFLQHCGYLPPTRWHTLLCTLFRVFPFGLPKTRCGPLLPKHFGCSKLRHKDKGQLQSKAVATEKSPYRVRDWAASGESLHLLGRCTVEGLPVERYLDDTEQALALSHPHEGTCESPDFHTGVWGQATLGSQCAPILRLVSFFCQVQPKT